MMLNAMGGRRVNPGVKCSDSASAFRVERVDRFRIRRVRVTPIPKKVQELQPSVVRVPPFAGAAMMTRVSA